MPCVSRAGLSIFPRSPLHRAELTKNPPGVIDFAVPNLIARCSRTACATIDVSHWVIRTMFPSRWIRCLICAALASPAGVLAAEVELAGVFGTRAVLLVNGGAPQTLSVGQRSREGVRLVALQGEVASVEIDGTQRRIRLGSAPIQIQPQGEAASEGGQELRLVPDARGHYAVQGSINGASVRFLVDTGASLVSMGVDEAVRAGIDYRKGKPSTSMTANGPTQIWVVRLDKVQVGGIVLHGVEAAVHQNALPVVLLGMSFLNRTDMRRDGGFLVLRKTH